MDVMSFIKGRSNLERVTAKLANALRADGLLVFNEVRLPSEMERAWWARWLVEGGAQHVDFINGRYGLRLIHKAIYEELHGYVIALFEKTC
jgi:hypothetical protein